MLKKIALILFSLFLSINTMMGTPSYAGSIQISQATYGFWILEDPFSLMFTNDVTDIIRKQCSGRSSCSIQINNDTMHGDPAPNMPKVVEVHGRCAGRAIWIPAYFAHENQTLKISC